MDDLHSRAEAFLRGPCIIGPGISGEPWRLICLYVDGKLGDGAETRSRLSRCLQFAQTEAARREEASFRSARSGDNGWMAGATHARNEGNLSNVQSVRAKCLKH
jgi:hypothetical protein